MIDAGKLLGGLLGGSGGLGDLGKLGLGGGALGGKAAVGMGLLGVAMAAFEHFAENQQRPVPAGTVPPMAPPAGGMTPPPVPGAPGMTPPPAPGQTMTPPPVPGAVPPAAPGAAPTAPPAAPAAAVSAADQADPMLLIRAMIASANADGVLDDTERMRILGQLEGVGLTEEEKDFLCSEFDSPKTVHEITAGATSPAVAAQVFTVSLLAVDVDTDEERAYLEALRQGLGLSVEQTMSIARRIGRSL